jgi:hypothetical protein
MDKKTLLKLEPLESQLLDVIETAHDFTTSDLQGILGEIIKQAYAIGLNDQVEFHDPYNLPF